MTFYNNHFQYAEYQPEQHNHYRQQYNYQQQKANYLPKINLPRPKNYSVQAQHRIIANLYETQYDVIVDVCQNVLDWKLVFQKEFKNWDIYWTDHAVSIQMLMKMESHQKINHFPGMSNLSRKNLLARNLYKMAEKFPQQYNFFPKTWLLPYDYNKLKNYLQQIKRLGTNKTFIVKPEASSQGRGIYLTKNINQIHYNEHCVVQKYITNPLLFQGLKFDLRVYVLVAGCDPLRLYIYNQGLVRLATEKYQKPNNQNMQNMYMHLTNYAINKDNPNFIFNETETDLNHGHKRSMAEFFQTLKKSGVNSVKIWADIKDIIVKTMISGQPYLAHQYRMSQPHNLENNMCFQILGFDLMVDSDEKVFLLEINYTPSFTCESPLDELVKSNLIKDTLILMNINKKNRQQILSRAKQIQQKRVFTGKSIKLTKSQRMKLIEKFQDERDMYEHTHLGSYEKLYPSLKDSFQIKYLQFLKYSQQTYNANNIASKKVQQIHNNSYNNIILENKLRNASINKSPVNKKNLATNISVSSEQQQMVKQKNIRENIRQNNRSYNHKPVQEDKFYMQNDQKEQKYFPNVNDYSNRRFRSNERTQKNNPFQESKIFFFHQRPNELINHFVSSPVKNAINKFHGSHLQQVSEDYTMFSRHIKKS